MALLLQYLLFSLGSSVMLLSPKVEVFSHTQASFGKHYGNDTIEGVLEESVPFDACTELTVNMTDKIVIAVRGGSPSCNFDTKVRNIGNAGGIAVIIMNKGTNVFGYDELIEMNSRDKERDSLIPSVLISSQSGNEILSFLHNKTLEKPVRIALNSTGEVSMQMPTFWDMVISFLQLSIVLWISIGFLYLFSYMNTCCKRYKRRLVLKKLKTVPYEKSKHEGYDCTECSICLDEFKEGEKVKILPCHHIFHEACTKGWVVDVRGVCPVCRQGIFNKEDENLAEEGYNRELNDLIERETLKTIYLIPLFCLFKKALFQTNIANE